MTPNYGNNQYRRRHVCIRMMQWMLFTAFVLPSLLFTNLVDSYSDERLFISFGRLDIPNDAALLPHIPSRTFFRRKRRKSKDESYDFTQPTPPTALESPPQTSRKFLRKPKAKQKRKQPEAVKPRATPEGEDQHVILSSLTQPLIEESAWNHLAGNEFQKHPESIDALVAMGEEITLQDNPTVSEWIEWKSHSSHKEYGKIEEGGIQVWTGRSKKEGLGSQVPWIKTRSIIPLSVQEMVDLLMDSNRVQTYNSWSLGRRDLWVADSYTKIVKNRMQPPLGSKPLVSTTFIHARPAAKQPGWITVSRAVGGHCFDEPEDASAGSSNILLGVNLLQPVVGDENSCIMTAVMHSYSSAVPLMLAERLGVKSAIKFVKDMRKLKVAAI